MLAYTADHLHVIGLVFGRRGTDLAARTHLAPAQDGRDRTDFDRVPGRDMIYHTPCGWADPLVVIHEFAHLYHAVNWRELSYTAPEVRCEAAAHLAEAWLAHRHTGYAALIGERIERWNPAARQLLNQLTDRGELDWGRELHDQMHMILAGRYVDRHPDLAVASG